MSVRQDNLFKMFHNFLDLFRPGQETFQNGIGRSIAQVSELVEKKTQIIERIQAVGLGCLHQCVNNSAGLRPLWRIAKQPVFPSNQAWQKILCKRNLTKSRKAQRKQGGIWRTSSSLP